MSAHDLADVIAALVRARHRTHPDVSTLAATIGADVVESVERLGVHAPLAHVHAYAHALGMDASLRVAERAVLAAHHTSCTACGETPTHHAQVHVEHLRRCLDVGIAPLVEALWELGITVTHCCEGGGHQDAHLVFGLTHARAFFAVVDRGDEDLRLRAGLRPFTPADAGRRTLRAWRHSIRWHLPLGELLADAECWVRLDSAELPGLTRLCQAPPPPPAFAR